MAPMGARFTSTELSATASVLGERDVAYSSLSVSERRLDITSERSKSSAAGKL